MKKSIGGNSQGGTPRAININKRLSKTQNGMRNHRIIDPMNQTIS